MTFADNLWLLFASLIGVGGACAICYSLTVVERLIERRRAALIPTNRAVNDPPR
jgi:hypothetical protein